MSTTAVGSAFKPSPPPQQDKDPAASYSPTGRPSSTIGAGGLNFRVRNGNGSITSAIATGRLERSQLHTGTGVKTPWQGQQKIVVKPHGQLVPVSSTHCCAFTPGLSTSSSSRGL